MPARPRARHRRAEKEVRPRSTSPAPAPIRAAHPARLFRLLGLGIRGRGAIVGVGQVRDAVRSNKVVLVVLAADASRHSLEKIIPLLRARGVRFIEVPSAADLGAAVGRRQSAVVGIVDRHLAAGLREAARGEPVKAHEEDV